MRHSPCRLGGGNQATPTPRFRDFWSLLRSASFVCRLDHRRQPDRRVDGHVPQTRRCLQRELFQGSQGLQARFLVWQRRQSDKTAARIPPAHARVAFAGIQQPQCHGQVRAAVTLPISSVGLPLISCSSSPPAVVTLVVGLEQRVFAAREDVLSQSSFFHTALQNGLMDSSTRCIALADEEPHVFSAVLEYLYTGDYTPRMVLNSRRNSWELEQNSDRENNTCSFYHAGVDGDVLKDTAIYCAAYKYDLEGLRKLALRKQGLRELSVRARLHLAD